MIKIYEHKGFPNPARVRIALAEKSAIDKVRFIAVDVPKGEHRRPEFLAMNPSGLVPVLELDDGTMISECTAITEYIDHAFSGPSLTGSPPVQRARIHMMQRRAEANLLDAVAAYFHNATPGLGPQIETYQNKEWGERQRQRALEGMRQFDGTLGKSAYVAGDDFSMADITVFAGLLFAGLAKLDVPAECSHLRAWHDKMTRRPSVAASIAA
jgi:glutathione S-transferase